ncbi:hypothetical protein P7C73_g5651, partial [Tremellales sp. Uapishka_1]
MFSKSTVATAAVLLSGSFAAAAATIATPASLIVCQPAALSWSGGTPPYILAVIPGGQVSAAALETLDDAETGTSYTWTVDLAANTYITLKLTDSTGAIAYSSPLTIQAGSSTSCLNGTATSLAASAGATSAVGGVVASASGSSTTSGSAISSLSSAAASSSAASSSASSSAAASSAASSTSSAGAVSSVSKAASSVASAAASATSAAASAVSSATTSGSMLNAVIGIPALALAAVGGFAALF